MQHSDNNKIFFDNCELSQESTNKLVDCALSNAEDGELYLESCYTEAFNFDDNVLKTSSYNINKGFGMRAVVGEKTAYAHSSSLTNQALQNACNTVKHVNDGNSFEINLDAKTKHTNHNLYTPENPIPLVNLKEKINLLQSIDAYLRNKNSLVKQVSTSISANWQAVRIIRRDGIFFDDIRPLIRLNISTIVESKNRMETGSYGMGGRFLYDKFFQEDIWQDAADQALHQALVNLDAIATPAGQMDVVLGSGWPGILLHEAVGHGLEGDFNRKKTSSFSNLIGQQVASKGVTVIDDGTIAERRGSLNIDDEGTPTQHNVLIEDGILKGYMQDRLNARLMGVSPTGNGRRESYQYQPLPRMTNTYMLGGKYSADEIISSVKRGIYAVNFGGGQVDITSGKFVFTMSEAYLIEDGKIKQPVKGATLIGNGTDALTKIKMIGNDMKLDPGIGTCGKAGQGVPVGVGQPTLLIEGLTVGGTKI